MAYTGFDIRQLVLSATPYPDLLKEKIAAADADINEIGQAQITDDLGNPYFMDLFVTLPGGEQVRFPNEPLISWQQRKTIVKTPLVGSGRPGTVKEYINEGDFHLNIRGVCIDPETPDRYPSEQVELVQRIVSAKASLPVQNDLLSLFGIEKIVIESCGWDEMEGVPGAQRYFIRAISDSDFLATRTANINLP